jgi:hypothetical protein
MRETNISIRTTPLEKVNIQRRAKRCGLSMSEYVRKLATGYDPKPLPSLEYRAMMKTITELYVQFNAWGETMYADVLIGVLREMQAAITPGKRGGQS